MKIAICDDSYTTQSELEELVWESFQGNKGELECDVFSSGIELIVNMEQQHLLERYQIYILDIEMDGINGLEVAARIRQIDQAATIIFATSHKELMQEAFDVNAFNYLVKPLDHAKAKRVLEKAYNFLTLSYVSFEFKIGKKNFRIRLDDIIYFEGKGRKIILHGNGENYEFYGSIKNLIRELDSHLFVQVHASFVVNMKYISVATNEEVILKNGEKIGITKKYHDLFNMTYSNFVLMRLI